MNQGYAVKFIDGQAFEYPLGKIVCVGRNYAEHAKELNNPIPSEPILFIKPETAAVPLSDDLSVPIDDCHYETELSILIGETLSHASEEQAQSAIAGIGLALDLTKRALQSKLKEKSHPWEIAKSFDGACPLSDFVRPDALPEIDQLNFSMNMNGELRQKGTVQDMLTPIIPLLVYMSRHFTLRPGDVVLTGTPKGVGQLQTGDKMEFTLADQFHFYASVK